MEQEKKKNIIIVLLAIVICCLVGYICYDKLLRPNFNEKLVDIKDVEKDRSDVESLDNGEFALRLQTDKSKVYLAKSSNYFSDGSKELVLSDLHELVEFAVYGNKIYYIDNQNRFAVYDVLSKQFNRYSFSGIDIHAHTFILPGKDFSIVSDGSGIVRINMVDSGYKKLDISAKSKAMVFDSDVNILYYANDSGTVSYDVRNEKQERVISNLGAFFLDDDYVYMGLLGKTAVMYNKKDHSITPLNITDYSPNAMSNNTIVKYGNSLYMLFGSRARLIKYTNFEESCVFEGSNLEVVAIGNKLYIVENGSPFANWEPKYYEYDMKSDSVSQSNNLFVIELFGSEVHYLG